MPPKNTVAAHYRKIANTKEKGYGKENFWAALGDMDYNPDNINITTYQKMILDAQVNAASRIRNLAVLSKGIDLEYHGEDEALGEEMKRYLRKAFTMVNKSINQGGGMFFVLDQLLFNGHNFGYSVGETVFGKYNEYGDGYVYPTKVKILPPKTLKNCFDISDYGDLLKVTQNRDTTNEVSWESNADLARLIIFVHNRQFSNWYGQSDNKFIYKNWFSKDYIIKFWNITIERYGSPFLLGKASNPAHLAAMNAALDSARTRTNFSIWANDDVKILESSSAQREAFKNAIMYHDQQIMIGKLVPLLIMGVEDTGARALGDTHFRAFLWTIKYDQRELSDPVNLWIKLLIDMNFPNVDAYPKMTFPVIANEDLITMTDAFDKLIKGEVIAPEEAWIRDMLGLPENNIIESTGGVFRSKTGWRMSIDDPDKNMRKKYTPKINEVKKLLNREEKRVHKIYSEYLDVQEKKVLENPSAFSRQLRKTEDQIITSLKVELTNFGDEVIDFEADNMGSIGLNMDTEFSRESLDDHISTLSDQSFKGSVEEIAFKAKEVVLDGRAKNLPNSEIAKNVSLIYNQYKRGQLETVVRTITNDVHNAARLELYKKNDDFVLGLRYDAIIDDRTTEFCSFHDGMQLPLNHPDVEALRPPNHFRCRSMYTPITILDGQFKDTYDPGSIYPAPDFGQAYFQNKYGGQ